MAHLSVHGTASRTVPPERATVLLGIVITGEQRAAVLARAQEVHAEVTTQVKALRDGGAVATWTAADVQVWAYQEWEPAPGGPGVGSGEQRQVRRFRAGTDLQVELAELAALGEWTAAVAELDGVEVRGITWDLAAATREAILREVRAEAAQDAAARARDYANALQLGGVRLLGLYEEGLHPGAASGVFGASPRAAKAMMADAGGGFELRPQEIEVTATVTAQFEGGPAS